MQTGSGGVSAEDLEVAAAKRELRAQGWYVRYTEWPSGHQVVVHLRSDTSVHAVTRWCATEAEAWREALAMAGQHAAKPRDPL
jgi:hypothetical protein